LIHRYPFDRAADGFPEKADLVFDRSIDDYTKKEGISLAGILDKNKSAVTSIPRRALYKLSARGVNATSGKTSESSVEVAPDAFEYLTWLPSVPALSGFISGRAAEISVNFQNFYGAAGTVFQISKLSPTADSTDESS
jgi:hypothetical protein